MHRGAARAQRVAILGVALPGPWDAEREGVARHVLDVAEQRRHLVNQVRTHRHETERAVADQHGRHPVLWHRIATPVPEQRRVEMGVHVDEARRNVRATRVEHARPRGVDRRADVGDAPIGHKHVGDPAGCTGAVDHGAPTQHGSRHRTPSSSDPRRAGMASLCQPVFTSATSASSGDGVLGEERDRGHHERASARSRHQCRLDDLDRPRSSRRPPTRACAIVSVPPRATVAHRSTPPGSSQASPRTSSHCCSPLFHEASAPCA